MTENAQAAQDNEMDAETELTIAILRLAGDGIALFGQLISDDAPVSSVGIADICGRLERTVQVIRNEIECLEISHD